MKWALALVLGLGLLGARAEASQPGLYNHLELVEQGYTLTAIFQYNIGTIVAGQPYTVSYHAGRRLFTVTGYSATVHGLNTQTYAAAEYFRFGEIIVWGGRFYLDGVGGLYDRNRQRVGTYRF